MEKNIFVSDNRDINDIIEQFKNAGIDYDDDNYGLDYEEPLDPEGFFNIDQDIIDIGNYDDPNESGYESDYTSELDEDEKIQEIIAEDEDEKIQEIIGEDEDEFLSRTLSSLDNEDDD